MKIIFFIQGHDVGGDDTVLVNLLKTWPNKSDIIEAWYNKGHKGGYLYRLAGVVPKSIDLFCSSDVNLNSKGFLKKIFRLLKLPNFLFSIIVFYLQLRNARPDVVFSHNGGYPGGELSLSFVIAAKLAGIEKIFLIIHNNAILLQSSWVSMGGKLLDKAVDGSCSRVISVSASCAQQIQEARFSNTKKVGFIHNGIVIERPPGPSLMDKLKKLNLEGGYKVIGSIGDYDERKGHEYLIRAFYQIQNEIPDAKLVIIGHSAFPHALVLKKLIAELHLEKNVILTGYLPAAWEYIECFDVFIFPSIAYESFGMVLLEAMLYKKPIIATDVGGIPEVLADTGIIVQPKDPQQLASAIRQIFNNGDSAKNMGEKGHARLISQFRAEFMAKEYYSLLR